MTQVLYLSLFITQLISSISFLPFNNRKIKKMSLFDRVTEKCCQKKNVNTTWLFFELTNLSMFFLKLSLNSFTYILSVTFSSLSMLLPSCSSWSGLFPLSVLVVASVCVCVCSLIPLFATHFLQSTSKTPLFPASDRLPPASNITV